MKLTKLDALGALAGALRYSAVMPLDAAAADLDAVEQTVRASGTSFYRGMRVLPPDRRRAMYAIYAFCRAVDDIADDEGPLAGKIVRLDGWRARVAGLYRGEADDAVTRVLLASVRAFGLRQPDFNAIIDGMQMDAEMAIVAPDRATLDLYCDRVASAVGRLSVRAFGDGSERADRVAYHLGRALQLTNILRDLAEDAGSGAVLLAREWLDQAGVPHDPGMILEAPCLPGACVAAASVAHAHFRDADAAMAACDRQAMKPARLMGATYAAILRRLERTGWRTPRQRVSLPVWQKLWLALRFGIG